MTSPFDFAPVTTDHLVYLGIAFLTTYGLLWWAIAHHWISLRPVRDKNGVYYGGAILLGVVTILTYFYLKEPALRTGLLLSSLAILIVGTIDENHPLSAGIQLIAQTLIATIVVSWGWTIHTLTNPWFGGVITLGNGSAFSVIFTAIVTIIWLLLLMNAINWFDGVDGLASGVSLIALFTIAAISLLPQVQDNTTLALTLIGAGALLGIFLWNFPPAKIYLGTTGSWFLGLYIGLTAMLGGGKIATAILVLVIPLADLFIVAIQRLAVRKPPWRGDTSRHLHYRLQARQFSPRFITLSAMTLTACLGIAAVVLQTSQKIIAASLAGGLVMISTLLLAVLAVNKLQKKRKIKPSAKYIILFIILITLGITTDYFYTPCRDFHQGRVRVGESSLNVALANTTQEHAMGLMYCRAMSNDSGMFFIFQKPQQSPFWMKHMLISLDILWIKNGRIFAIMENIPPADSLVQPQLYLPNEPYDSVLEVPSGVTEQQGIQVGDSIVLDINS